jgi:hypothetical protein
MPVPSTATKRQFGGEENSTPAAAAAAKVKDPQGLIEQGARFVEDMRHQSKM